MRRLFFILGFLLAVIQGQAATWFVRPGVVAGHNYDGTPVMQTGVYGTQDGTSYANAWNGLISIAWGEVNTADTIYICGLHVYSYNHWSSSYWLQATAKIQTSGITIRMDWPGDVGTIFGGVLDFVTPPVWYGPDTNGVYWRPAGAALTFEVHGNNITRMKNQTNTTWVGGLGSCYYANNTNFIKMSDGSQPTSNTLATPCYGWTLDLNNHSNIVFLSCNFISPNTSGNSGGCLKNLRPTYGSGIACNHITFANCTFCDGMEFFIYPGEDDWTFDHCDFRRMPSAIYTLLDNQSYGAMRLTVSYCHMQDLSTPEYPSSDGQAVGIQGGNGHLVQFNTISNAVSPIGLWTGSASMSFNTICYNYICNSKPSGMCAIGISGDNSLTVFGLRTGNRIFGNIIENVSGGSSSLWLGDGISWNCPDYVQVYNNTIDRAYVGIRASISQGGCPVNAAVLNNIITSPSGFYYYIAGAAAPTNLVVDYNLYYPASGPSSQFTFSPSVAHDAHSVFKNPQYVAVSPLLPTDFQLQPASPAIRAGTPVGLSTDFAGNPIPTSGSTDIGAYQSATIRPAPPTELQVGPGPP